MARDSTQTWHHERVTPWYDTHVHLDRYAEPERGVLLQRASASGVVLIAVATNLHSSVGVIALLKSHEAVAGGVVGVHPKDARESFEQQLTLMASHPGIVGIGECGFDADGPAVSLQSETFLAQCRIAHRLDLPLVLHIDGDGAWDSFVEHEAAFASLRVVRHYFTGGTSQAEWHRERGHFLSFGNLLAREPRLREIARRYPAELLLIETDSYPLPGRSTEPAHVVGVGETLAVLRGWTLEEARTQLAVNTAAAFPAMSGS